MQGTVRLARQVRLFLSILPLYSTVDLLSVHQWTSIYQGLFQCIRGGGGEGLKPPLPLYVQHSQITLYNIVCVSSLDNRCLVEMIVTMKSCLHLDFQLDRLTPPPCCVHKYLLFIPKPIYTIVWR